MLLGKIFQLYNKVNNIIVSGFQPHSYFSPTHSLEQERRIGENTGKHIEWFM